MPRNTTTTPRSRTAAARRPARSVPAVAATDPGYIEVRVGRLPGRIETIALNGGRTVNDALGGAGLRADGYEVRVNGSEAALDAGLNANDTVLLVKKITGNR